MSDELRILPDPPTPDDPVDPEPTPIGAAPETVSLEAAAIAEFKKLTPRRSTLTLNELNYISDKQLHKEDSGEGGSGNADLYPDIPFVFDVDTLLEDSDPFPLDVEKWTARENLVGLDDIMCMIKYYEDDLLIDIYVIGNPENGSDVIFWVLDGGNFYVVYHFDTSLAEITASIPAR